MLTVIVSLQLVSCNKIEEKVRMGFIMDDYSLDRFKQDSLSFYQKSIELGAEVFIGHGDQNADKQLEVAKDFIKEKKVDVLVLIASDKVASKKVVDFATENGVKTIMYDRLVEDCEGYYVSFDGHLVGYYQADFITDTLKKGNLIIMNGPVSDNNALAFREGQMDALRPYIESGQYNVLYDEHLSSWGAESSFDEMAEIILDQHDSIHGVICANDALAKGAIDALSTFRNGELIPVTGQDGMPGALRRILDGKQSMTILKPVITLAELTAELAYKIGNGEEPKNEGKFEYELIQNRSKKAKYIKLEVMPVTLKNIHTFISLEN